MSEYEAYNCGLACKTVHPVLLNLGFANPRDLTGVSQDRILDGFRGKQEWRVNMTTLSCADSQSLAHNAFQRQSKFLSLRMYR